MRLKLIDETGTEYWTASECAAYLGIAPDTWTAYVSRGQAPVAATRWHNLRVWSAREIRQWHEQRPRQAPRSTPQ
nr:MAG TPA: Pyocin activator protein PrtN [Caudoviricetes sp.]